MAKINNPAKEFQFRITLAGLNAFLCQEVTLPDQDVDVVEHGDANYMVKTGGMSKLGHMMVDKICSAGVDVDTFVWAILEAIQDTALGGGLLPSAYKTTCLVEQLSNDGVTPTKAWLLEGVWPHKVNGVKFSRTSSANTAERIEFCVDKMHVV